MREKLPSGTSVEIVRPVGGGAVGAVMIPDIGGLRPLFDRHVEELAGRIGGPVAAVEPWPGREHLPLEERLAAGSTVTDGQLLDDAVAAADLVGSARVGVVGFCMGGMFTLKAAGLGRFDAAVAFYGMIRVPEAWDNGGVEPLVALDRPGACPTLAIVGTDDPWTPAADVEELDRRAHVTVVRYDGADHGFAHDPERPAHRPEDAADAWERAVAHLSG